MSNTRFRLRRMMLNAACAALVAGCHGEGEGPAASERPDATPERRPVLHMERAARAPADAIPDLVPVPGHAALVSGFAAGVLRTRVDVAGFRITRHPVTRAQYGQCVDAGACEQSAQAGCAPAAFAALRGRGTGEPESPELCTSVKEAAQYCSWVGGRLPRFPEWLLAARGPSPQRFAWGDSEPTCAQHPRAADAPGPFAAQTAAPDPDCAPSDGVAPLVIGEHTAGAARSGMQDVLLTPGELLASQTGAQFAACSPGFAGCLVLGRTPGEIDAVYPIVKHAVRMPAEQRAPQVYGFRCVLEEN